MGVALLTLIVALAYVPGLPSNAAVGRWIAILLGALLLLQRLPIVPGRGHWLFAALVAYMLAGFAWTVSAWDTAGGIIQWAALLATFCVAYQETSLERFWRALALGVSVSAPFAVVQWLGYAPVWNAGGLGTYGLFLTENMASEAAVLGLVAAFAIRSWPLAIGPAILAYTAYSKAALVAIPAALAVYVWVERPRDRGWVVVWIGVSLYVLFFVWWFGAFPRLFIIGDRLELWSLFLRNTNLLGDGLNSIPIAAPSIEFAHNEVVHYAFELGIGSLLLWALVWHAARGGEAAAIAGLAAIGAFALVWFPFHDPLPAYVFAVLAGYLSNRRDRALWLERAVRAYRRSRLRRDLEPLTRRAAWPSDGSGSNLSARP